MSKPVISVENLSKAYRIGLREEIPDTLVGAVTGILKAPFRNWRRLRRLDVSVDSCQFSVDSCRLSVDSEAKPANGNGDAGDTAALLSTANCQLSTSLNGHSAPAADTIWALKDVSFEVAEGEVVGIIGRNGAGKSTLLKVLSRITEPTSGRAVIRGRVSSLLEVGTGFHPELTGRENVYMNGTILGMTKREIDRKFDEIVAFSGVERFLDTPVKRYSSGMKVRLAFAVAAHLDPEILIIDEVLAVGDIDFQNRCLGKMQDVAAGGRTVLFVSHNMAAVESLCQRGLVVESGRVVFDGDARASIKYYCEAAEHTPNRVLQTPLRSRIGHDLGDFQVIDVGVTSEGRRYASGFPTGAPLEVSLRCRAGRPIAKPVIAIRIHKLGGGNVTTLHTERNGTTGPESVEGEFMVICAVKDLQLAPGTYTLTVGVRSLGRKLDLVENATRFVVLSTDYFGTGRPQKLSDGCVVCHPIWTFERR